MHHNHSEIQKLLQTAKTIAIVGLSNEREKDSYQVALYLQKQGYKVIPVNPKYPEILGEKAYSLLKDIPIPIDIIDVFRRTEAIPEIAKAALELTTLPKAFWMQVGIEHPQAAQKLQEKGILVIQNECIKLVHQNLQRK